MSRVPLGTAAAIGEVSRATIHKWVERGHINRYDDGDPNGPYESNEIHLWQQQIRSPKRAHAGKMTAHQQYQQEWMAS